jgi:hypothetical protein
MGVLCSILGELRNAYSTEDLSLRVRQVDLEADYSSSSSAVVKGVWSHTTTVTIIFHHTLFLAVAPSLGIAS